MSFPSHEDVADALLAFICLNGWPKSQISSKDAYEPLADYFELSDYERQMTRDEDRHDGRPGRAWDNRVQWARQRLLNKGHLLRDAGRGVWKLSPEGKSAAENIIHRNRELLKLQKELPTDETSGQLGISLPCIDLINLSVREGGLKLVEHIQRERNRKIINDKKQQVLHATGQLTCEVCDFNFERVYGDIGRGFCEVHHKVLLSETDTEVTTKLEDLAILCSNCHRMIHRLPLKSVEEFRQLIKSRL